MLKDIVAVEPLPRHCLKLRFEDGAEGIVKVSGLVPLTGVFAPLRKRKEFLAVRVEPELGTVVWPCQPCPRRAVGMAPDFECRQAFATGLQNVVTTWATF